jgi:hypothetical protein
MRGKYLTQRTQRNAKGDTNFTNLHETTDGLGRRPPRINTDNKLNTERETRMGFPRRLETDWGTANSDSKQLK